MFTFKVMRPTPHRFDEDWTVFEGAAYAVEDEPIAPPSNPNEGPQVVRVLRVFSEQPYSDDIHHAQSVETVCVVQVSGPIYVMNSAGKTIDRIHPLIPSALTTTEVHTAA